MKKFTVLLTCIFIFSLVSFSIAGDFNGKNGSLKLGAKGIGFLASLLAKDHPDKKTQEVEDEAETTLKMALANIQQLEKNKKGNIITFGPEQGMIVLNDQYAVVSYNAWKQKRGEAYAKPAIIPILFQRAPVNYVWFLCWSDIADYHQTTPQQLANYFSKFSGVNIGTVTAQAPAQTLTLAER